MIIIFVECLSLSEESSTKCSAVKSNQGFLSESASLIYVILIQLINKALYLPSIFYLESRLLC